MGFIHILQKTFYIENESGNNIRFLFNDEKKAFAKKNRPLMKNCRKFFSNGSKNHNSSLASLARQAGDFCFCHCSEFLTGIFSHAGLYIKKIKSYFESNYANNN